MTLTSWYNRSVLLLLLLAISAYSTASQAPEFAVLAIPTVFALWRLSCRRAGRFLLPRFVVNILLMAVIAYAVLRAQGAFAVETIAQVVVLIQVIKIGDRRSPRDDAQILSLAVFLAIAAMLDSNGLWTGIQLVAFLPLLVITVMLFQLFKGAHAAGAVEMSQDASRGTGLRRQLRLTTAFASIGTIGLALVVFVLLPRGVGENVFPSFGMQRSGKQTAFSSSVTLGGKGIISESPTIVLDMSVRDASGENCGRANVAQYLRGAVLDEYDGQGRWTTSPPDRPLIPIKLKAGEQGGKYGGSSSPMIEQTISLHGTPGNTVKAPLFTLWRPVDVSVARAGTLWHDARTHVFQLQTEPGSFKYRVWSSPSDSERSGEGDRTRITYNAPKVKALASSILADSAIDPDPSVRPPDQDTRAIRLIQDYLRSKYSYTLELAPPKPGQDPVDFFLFERKKGHCEYFASAMVLMCRSVGIDARMVTGYLATEYSETSGGYLVRESNAHAWVEAEDGDHRWRPFDPTPQDELMRIQRPALGLLGRLRHAMEAVEYAWNSSVVSFDESARQKILGPSAGPQASWLAKFDRLSSRVRIGGMPLMFRALATGVLVFAGMSVAGFILRAAIRLVVGRVDKRSIYVPGAVRTESRFYRDLLRQLSKAGLEKPPWRPPLEHAATLTAVDSVLASDVREVASRYYAERFGGVSPDSAGRKRLSSLIDRVRRFRRLRKKP